MVNDGQIYKLVMIKNMVNSLSKKNGYNKNMVNSWTKIQVGYDINIVNDWTKIQVDYYNSMVNSCSKIQIGYDKKYCKQLV